MKTPGYWSDLNPLSLLLSPLGLLYNLGTRLNMSLHKPQKAAVPVVCIGNLTAGGTGKTPTAVSIAKLMQQANRKPFLFPAVMAATCITFWSTLSTIHRSRSATNRCCWPDRHRRLSILTVLPQHKRLRPPERKWSLWMTVFKIPACIRICHFLFLTAVSVTATVCAFRPGPCGKACLPE